MTKSLNEYTIKEFREMELFGEDCLFNNVVIVPMNELHEYSGYRCMKFILCRNGDIVGAVSGWSDIVHPNGIGNHGLFYDSDVIPYIGLSIDCLVGSGCVRLMMCGLYKCSDFIGSDFVFYFTRQEKQNDKS